MKLKRRIAKRNVIIMVIAVLVIIGAILIYMLITDLKQEDIFRAEVATLVDKDITKDRYNTSIKTKGDYGIVENAMKSYLDEYSVTFQEVLGIYEDEELINMLSADNYEKDGPDFTVSKQYLSDTKDKLKKDIERLTTMASSDEIMKNIEDKNLDTYYNDLYKELMLNGIAENDFTEAQADLESIRVGVNNLLDTEEAVIDLLIANKGKWKIKDKKIVFDEVSTLNQYNELIKNVA